MQCIVVWAVLSAPMLVLAQMQDKAVPVVSGGPVSAVKPDATTPQPALREASMGEVADRLALDPAQRRLWEVYAARVDAYASGYYRERPLLPSAEVTATHQVEHMVNKLQNRLAALEDVEFAVKQLYASLTPMQQKTANEWLALTLPKLPPQGNLSAAEPCGQSSRRDVGKGPRGGAMGGPMMTN